VFLPLLQTDSPDGSTIHASRLQNDHFISLLFQRRKEAITGFFALALLHRIPILASSYITN